MRLIEFIQKYQVDMPMGEKLGGEPREISSSDESAYEDLRRVQATNDLYFKIYWITLIAVFITTVVVALIYRDEMGGLATVLGAGGVIQGGLVIRLSAEWKEKSRIDIVAVLTRRLTPEQLQIVLQDLLTELREK